MLNSSSFYAKSARVFRTVTRKAGTLFFIFSLLAVVSLVVVSTARAGVPSYSGGGPGNGQVGTPPDALIDINANEALTAGTVIAGDNNVSLKKCTGATDALTCVPGGSDATTNLCATVTPTSSTNILCIPAAPLEVNTTYRFRIGTSVQTASTNQGAAANFDRIFRTGGFSGGTNTTPWRFMSNTPNAGQQFPANGVFILEAPQGPEGVLGAGSVSDHLNYTLKLLSNGAPTGSDLCTGAGNCVLIRIEGSGGGDVIVIRPTPILTAGQEYEFQVSNLQNAALVPMGAPLYVRFMATTADATAPTLRTTALGGATLPADAATGVSRSVGNISVFFSEAVRPDSINATNVRLYIDANANSLNDGGDTTLNASNLFVDYDPFQKLARLTPKALLAASTRYCFDIVGGVSGVKDLVDNPIVPVVNKCFTTNDGIGDNADTTKPTLTFADADNFKLVARVSETLKPGTGANGAENPANYTLECPVGVAVNMTGKTIVYRPESKEIEIQGLGCLNGNTGKLTIATAVQDLAGNAFDNTGTPAQNIAQFTILNAATTGGYVGSAGAQQDFASSTNFATFWENPQRCQPRTMATGKSTTVECEFATTAALATDSKFILTFPSGFTVTSAAAVAASASFMNGDLNGPGPGITTITGVAADNGAGTVTVTIAHSGTAMGSADRMRFELSGITTPASATTDARISIIVKDASGVKQGQTINASPFQIQQAGTLEIKGAVFKDSNFDGVKDSGEGIGNIKVYCNQMGGFQVSSTAGAMMGFQEATTDNTGGANTGNFSFTGLTSGQYGCNIPPQTALNNASVGGSSPFQNVALASTSKSCVPASGRSDCVDFKFTDLGGAGARTLTVNITGGPVSTELDAFCFSPNNFQSSAPVMKSLTTDGSGVGSTTLKLQNSVSYDCGIGPHIAFESFGTGAPPAPPTFSFMPPRPQPVTTAASITFALTATNRTITGTVTDGSTGIANVFVHASPAGCFDATTGDIKECNGAFAQTKTDGTFTLNVSDGTYEIGADGPGLPPSTRATANVKGSSVSGVTLKIVKSSTTIAGTIKDESGNGIKYAHVSGQKIATGGTCSSSTPAGGFSDSPTDSSGNYTLYTSAGTWCVRAFAPSYGEIGNKTVVVSTSQTGQNISATAAEYGTITATITSGGTAVTSGFFNCFGSSGGNNAQIGSDGTISLKAKAGTGYTCDGFVPGVGPITRQSSVTVASNTTTALGTIALGNAGTITVTVTGISNGFCDAKSSTGIGSGAPLTGGTATIKVQAGTYTVRCGSPKTGELVNQSGVAVTAGGSATVTGTPPTTRTVQGRVTDGTSNLEGVTLNFTERSTGRGFTTTTGNQISPTNNLSATAVPEGTYNVVASKKSFGSAATTATVSGGTLTIATLALTPTTASSGETVNIPITASSTAYTGDATVIATKTDSGVTTTIVGEIDATAGTAALDLTNGAWTLKAIGDNGKESSTSTITIAGGAVSGLTPTLDLATTITGFTAASQSETVALSSGGLLKYKDLAVGGVSPEINVPKNALSTSDSSTGKVEMKADPTLAGIDPGADANFVGKNGFDITPKDANGNPITDISGTVTITMPYTDADVSAAGVSESKLQFASFDATTQTWEKFPTTVDTTNNLLTVSITHFSNFGIIGGVSTASVGSSSGDMTAPAAPSAVSATSDGSKVTLTWTDPTDSDLYRIEVLRNDGNGTEVTGDVRAYVEKGTKQYIDTSVTAGKTYKYILKSRDFALNQKLSDEYSVAVTAPVVTVAPGGGGATPSTPSTTTPTTPATPVATTPVTTIPATTVATPAKLIHDPSKLDELLSGLALTRSQSEEAKYMPLIKSDAIAFKIGLTEAQETALANFVSYGASAKTKELGAGERRAVIRDYLETVGRADVKWDDVERMTKGEKPVARNLEKERAQVGVALKVFAKMYGQTPNFQDAKQDLTWNTLLYRIRFTRDLVKEKEGIAAFRKIFKNTPRTPLDWSAVRALGYVK